MIDLINDFQFSNTVVQHDKGKINSWISGMGYQSYGLYLNEKLKQFSTNKFLIHTLDSTKQLNLSIKKYLSNHQFIPGYEQSYPRKLFCFDTILNPITETDISLMIKNELGFNEETQMIQQRIELTDELIECLPDLQKDSKMLNSLETINTIINTNSKIESLMKINETKNKKQVQSGFENKSSFKITDLNLEELQIEKKYLEKRSYLLDQFNLIKENKIVGIVDLNLLPFFTEVTVPIRRINLLIGINKKVEDELLGYIIRYLYNKGVKSLIMMVDINSPDRKIFENLRKYTTLEQNLFIVYRKEGPDYEEVLSWINKSERVDYIELAMSHIYGSNN